MFFGWRVVAGAFVGMFLANGVFTYAFTVLVDPIREEFGVGLEQVMYSLTIGTFLGLICAPVTGMMVDRYSVRHIMTLGCVITVVGLFAIAGSPSITAFNIGVGVTMALSLATAGPLAGSAAVSRWFDAHRGKALGIAAMGTSLGGIVVPVVLTYWVDSDGWRQALRNTAWFTLFVLTPFVFMTVRNHPRDLGLQPDNADAVQHDQVEMDTSAVMGMADIVKTKAFWLIGLSMGAVFAAFASMVANLAPYSSRLGVSDGSISVMIASLAMAGFVGKLIFGTAADKIELKHGLWAAHALLGIAFLILIFEPPYALQICAAVCFGLSTGGLLPVWNALVAKTFGIASFGRAMGAMGPIMTLCILPSYSIVGRLFDSTGSYTTGLILFSGIIVLAALLLIPLESERPKSN